VRGSDIELKQALRYCDGLTRQHSSTFYLGSRLFPARQRQAVSVIYAVCRSGDDAVDEAESAAAGRERLARWWGHIERAYAGAPSPNEPLELALAWVLSCYDVPKDAFTELYLGFLSDLDPQPFNDLAALMLYCRQVAGVVGLMVAPIAGYRGGEATLQDALALGQAMQLTNILRDVGEDMALGRCYLPQALMARHGVTIEMLREGRVTEGYRALLKELSALARKLYRLGWRGILKLHGPAASAVAVAALNYEEILHKLQQNDYDNLTRRAYLRPLERLALIPRAIYGVLSRSLA